MAGSKETSDETEADRSDEAWIRTANSDQAIRVRSLSMMLDKGTTLTDARLVEQEDGLWVIYFRLSDRPGEYRLNMAKFDQPKTYKDVALAIASIREDFHYVGPITCVTDRHGDLESQKAV